MGPTGTTITGGRQHSPWREMKPGPQTHVPPILIMGQPQSWSWLPGLTQPLPLRHSSEPLHTTRSGPRCSPLTQSLARQE